MKILISGSSSKIGIAIIEHLEKSSAHSLQRTQRSDINSPFYFDLKIGKDNSFNSDETFDVFIHTGWIMNSSYRDQKLNIESSKKILEDLSRQGTHIIFLSTLSAMFEKSDYGAAKREVENAVVSSNGTVLRVGYIRPYSKTKGIQATLSKIGKSKYFDFQVFPDAGLIPSSLKNIVNLISDAIEDSRYRGQISYSVENQVLSVNSEIRVELRETDSKDFRVKVLIPLRILRWISRLNSWKFFPWRNPIASAQSIRTLSEAKSDLADILKL
jgi:hypothetical protein